MAATGDILYAFGAKRGTHHLVGEPGRGAECRHKPIRQLLGTGQEHLQVFVGITRVNAGEGQQLTNDEGVLVGRRPTRNTELLQACILGRIAYKRGIHAIR